MAQNQPTPLKNDPILKSAAPEIQKNSGAVYAADRCLI